MTNWVDEDKKVSKEKAAAHSCYVDISRSNMVDTGNKWKDIYANTNDTGIPRATARLLECVHLFSTPILEISTNNAQCLTIVCHACNLE